MKKSELRQIIKEEIKSLKEVGITSNDYIIHENYIIIKPRFLQRLYLPPTGDLEGLKTYLLGGGLRYTKNPVVKVRGNELWISTDTLIQYAMNNLF